MAGWSRSGLEPLNPQKVLSKSEISTYRPITPNLILPPNQEYNTPTTRNAFQAMAVYLKGRLTPQSRHLMTGTEHAFSKEHSARICLQAEEFNACRRTHEAEEQATMKRLKKTDQKIT